MKKLRNLIIGLAGCFLASIAQAQWYPPIIYVPTPGTNSSDCIGNYVGISYVTNENSGTVWFPPPNDAGILKAHVEGFSDVGITTVRRGDGYVYCSPTNGMEFYVRTNSNLWGLKFIIYFHSTPPTNADIHLVFDKWPEKKLEITSLSFPEGTNKSQVQFLVHAGGTNIPYQLWYSQTLVPFDATNWIPHSAFWGQLEPFTVTQTAHMTRSNRPYGFWQLRQGSVSYPGNIDQEDVDPPLPYPEIIICTNCGGDITPPTP